MKYTSKDIQQILTSKTAIDGLDYITPIYQEAKTALWIMEAMGVQADLFVKWVKEITEQILPQTATWALDYWEEEYSLPVRPNLSIEQRRQKIINAVRTRAPMNPEKLEELLERVFQIDKVKVVERTAKNTFAVEFYKQIWEQQWQEIFDMIEKYKPAHLILEAKSVLETPMPEKKIDIDGAIFRPIAETILPELEYEYHFDKKLNVGGMFQSITETTLPEMPFEVHANVNIITDYCNIEVTTLSELKR